MPNLIIGGAELITKIWYFHRNKLCTLNLLDFIKYSLPHKKTILILQKCKFRILSKQLQFTEKNKSQQTFLHQKNLI